MESPPDFIVIGGGLGGLVCAYQLQKKGHKVLVIEKNPRPGGRLQTIPVSGCRSDTGAQFLSRNYPVITQLINELKLSEHTSEISSVMNFYSRDQRHTLNTRNPLALYQSGLLSFSSFSRLSFEILKSSRKLRKLNVENAADLAAFDEMTAEEYLNKNMDFKIRKNLFEPFFSGFNYASSTELSEAMVYRTIGHILTMKNLFSLSSGMASLIEVLSSKLNILTGKEVKNLNFNQELWRVEGEGFSYTAKKLVIATTAPVARLLLGNDVGTIIECLNVTYAPSLHLGLVFQRKNEFKPVYGNMVMHDRNPDFNVITFESQKGKSLCSADTELIHLLASSKGYEKEMRGEEILTSGLQLMEEISPYKREDLLEMVKTLWPFAIPVFSPGRAKIIKNYRQSVSRNDSIFLAGDYMGTPCAEGAAESGEFIASLF